MAEPQPETQHGLVRVYLTLFVFEYGDTTQDPGYIVRFSAGDRGSHARLSGLLFSMPEGRARHLMNNVWWLHEETVELLVKAIPILGAQIAQLAAGDPTLPAPPDDDETGF